MDARGAGNPKAFELRCDGCVLLLALGVRGVRHVKQQVGGFQFLQGGSKSSHEMRWQFMDETHGVRQEGRTTRLKRQSAHGGIESCEKFWRRVYGRLRESVEDGGFAGIGVTHKSHREEPLRTAVFSLKSAPRTHVLDGFLQPP